MSLNKAKIDFVVFGSNADVASSHKRISGFKASALAIATLCFCPPLNCLGLLFFLSDKPTNSKSSETLLSISALEYPQHSNGKATLSYTFLLSSNEKC